MQLTTVLISLFAGLAVAAPASLEERQFAACSGLYGTAQCCATDVLGVADLNCGNREFSQPENLEDLD
jgi:hypothetical protein